MKKNSINIKGFIPMKEANYLLGTTGLSHYFNTGELTKKNIGGRSFVKFDNRLKRLIERKVGTEKEEIKLKNGMIYYGSMGRFCKGYNEGERRKEDE